MDIKIQEKLLREFAETKNLEISPKYSFEYWAWLVSSLGRCPCKPDRSNCPCPQSEQEIIEVGHCYCKFFMTKEYYKNLIDYYKSKGKTLKRKELK